MATPNNAYGLTSVTFGVPATLTGFVVQAVTTSAKNNVAAEIFDEKGVRVVSYYDDLTTEITLDVIFQGGTVPVPGAVMTYDAIKYEVQSVDSKWSNKDFRSVSIKGKNSEGITLS